LFTASLSFLNNGLVLSSLSTISKVERNEKLCSIKLLLSSEADFLTIVVSSGGSSSL